MTGQKNQAGDAFASLRQQRRVKAAPKTKAEVKDKQERKTADMKNAISKQDAAQTALRTQQQSSEHASEELFNPQEWEALLNSFENDASQSARSEPPVELSTEDLWERLSSTRWIRTPATDEDGNDSTVAIRPMD